MKNASIKIRYLILAALLVVCVPFILCMLGRMYTSWFPKPRPLFSNNYVLHRSGCMYIWDEPEMIYDENGTRCWVDRDKNMLLFLHPDSGLPAGFVVLANRTPHHADVFRSDHNTVVATIPSKVDTAYIIDASGQVVLFAIDPGTANSVQQAWENHVAQSQRIDDLFEIIGWDG